MLDIYDVETWTPEVLDGFLAQYDDVDWRRFEIVDGALILNPPALPSHDSLALYLGHQLIPALPHGVAVSGAVRIRIGSSWRVSDAAVLPSEVLGQAEPDPAALVIAIEIESPSSRTTDRVTKPAQYASAGVAHYWRVETTPLRLVTYRLADGVYVESGSWAEGEIAAVREPFAVDIEIAALLPG